jgi:hypothetical protein
MRDAGRLIFHTETAWESAMASQSVIIDEVIIRLVVSAWPT